MRKINFKIEDWKKENDFKYVIYSVHTARLKKVLSIIFPKNEGWKFSVSKQHASSVNINIMEMPVDIDDCVNVDKVKHKFFISSNIGTEELIKYYKENTSHGGYNAYRDDYHEGIIKTALEIIEKSISFAIAPVETVSVDGDYGNIPNYYKNVIIGKWDKPFKKAENGKVLNKNEYLKRFECIKNEIEAIRKLNYIVNEF